VIEHYNSGVKPHPNLDPRLRVAPQGRPPPPGSPPPPVEPRKLTLSQADKAALVAFLETLTDEAMITDPKYSSPFVEKAP
jgi:cytochrome c peroxidase